MQGSRWWLRRDNQRNRGTKARIREAFPQEGRKLEQE